MEIITCDQGTPEWMAYRIGSIGGSSISAVCAKGRGSSPSKTRETLLYRFAGEILSGEKGESFTNQYMQMGIELEPDARTMYEFINDCTVEQVGLIRAAPYKHVSPDGLVRDDGMIEIKSVIPSTQARTVYSDSIPPEYIQQMQWSMFCAERKWCDFVSYSPTVKDCPIWIRRLFRDDEKIAEMNKSADEFIREMLEIVEKCKSTSQKHKSV